MAQALGKPLLPHQRALADAALEIDVERGRMAYDQVVLVGPRQVTGKSEFLLDVMAHRCVGFGQELVDWIAREHGVRHPDPGMQQVRYIAQTADLAREKWRDGHLTRLDRSPFKSLYAARLRLNQEAIVWRNGSVWSPSSATAKTAGTGDSLDVGVIDEAWSRRDGRTELGLRPAMLTRPWRQLWVASMVPGPSRVMPHEWPYLRTKMAAGRARVEAGVCEGTCYVEFSASPGADPADPATWWSCMPALGWTVDEAAVRSDFDSELPLADFEAEYLGWAPSGGAVRWVVIREATWGGLVDPHSVFGGVPALGLAVTPESSAASIDVAGLRGDGHVHVELVDRRPGTGWVVARVVALVRAWGAAGIALDPATPAVALLLPLKQALEAENLADVPVVTPSARGVSGACGRFLAATGQVDETATDARGPEDEPVGRRLRHLGQPEFDRAVASASRKFVGRLWRWAPAAHGMDITPLEAATVAVLAGESVDWAQGTAYDLASSLG